VGGNFSTCPKYSEGGGEFGDDQTGETDFLGKGILSMLDRKERGKVLSEGSKPP